MTDEHIVNQQFPFQNWETAFDGAYTEGAYTLEYTVLSQQRFFVEILPLNKNLFWGIKGNGKGRTQGPRLKVFLGLCNFFPNFSNGRISNQPYSEKKSFCKIKGFPLGFSAFCDLARRFRKTF